MPRPSRLLVPTALLVLTLLVTVDTARTLLVRYRELNLGWSWDLAYYNQWFYSLTRGDGALTVRPSSAYGREGRSAWVSNYLAPIRLAILPIYAARPGPETLLVIAAVATGLIVPAAFLLAKGETGSDLVGLGAASLAVLTPLLGPLRENDFRELQLAMPFVLLAIAGVRSRSVPMTAVGVGVMLACRQELALVVASFSVLPPREPEAQDRRDRWASRLFLLGVGWTLLFFVYLCATHGPATVKQFLEQFEGPGPTFAERFRTMRPIVVVGMASWSAAALFAPRAALLALPWLWNLVSGRWALHQLGGVSWHHVRYAAPFVATGLAAGIIGLCAAHRRTRSPVIRTGIWFFAFLCLYVSKGKVDALFARAPRTMSRAEAAALREVIGRVGPDEAVVADYVVCAPLSSRRVLMSYVMNLDAPPNWPKLGSEFAWVFADRKVWWGRTFTDQGFETILLGPTIGVYHRPSAPDPRPTLGFGRGDAIIGPDPGRLLVDFLGRDLIWVPVVILATVGCGLYLRLRPRGGDAAFERALAELAEEPGPAGRLQRLRPSAVLAVRLVSIASWATGAVGLALGVRPLLALAATGFSLALRLAAVEFWFEMRAAARSGVWPPAFDNFARSVVPFLSARSEARSENPPPESPQEGATP